MLALGAVITNAAIIGLVITVGCFFEYAVGALRERSSDELTALKLEEQFGIKDNVLINTMQFEDMGYSEDQKAFVNATADAAADAAADGVRA